MVGAIGLAALVRLEELNLQDVVNTGWVFAKLGVGHHAGRAAL